MRADYHFQGNLGSAVPGAPELTSLVGSGPNSFTNDLIDGYARQTLRFPLNSGVAFFGTNGVIPNNNYTIVGLFKMDDVSGFRRIADFKNGTSQTGAYFFNGRLEGELTTNIAVQPNTYVQTVLTRELNGRVRGYRDGRLVIEIANDGGKLRNKFRKRGSYDSFRMILSPAAGFGGQCRAASSLRCAIDPV
ncbi:MAG: hypothetical protein IPJ30_24130 [Acidobacteria bacterium]|nr:hypothetical protein [Acidobacteriota bacterium]